MRHSQRITQPQLHGRLSGSKRCSANMTILRTPLQLLLLLLPLPHLAWMPCCVLMVLCLRIYFLCNSFSCFASGCPSASGPLPAVPNLEPAEYPTAHDWLAQETHGDVDVDRDRATAGWSSPAQVKREPSLKFDHLVSATTSPVGLVHRLLHNTSDRG